MANNTIVINLMECQPVAFCLIAVLCVCFEKSTFTTFPKKPVVDESYYYLYLTLTVFTIVNNSPIFCFNEFL